MSRSIKNIEVTHMDDSKGIENMTKYGVPKDLSTALINYFGADLYTCKPEFSFINYTESLG